MKLFTALENEAVIEPNAGQQKIQELEGQLSDHEVTQAYSEISSNQNISDNAKADVGTLAKVNDILTEATENNKVLTKDVLWMSKVVTESICARLGYKATSSLFIATEGINDNTRYQEAISLESFGEMLKHTWEAIVRFFKRIVEGMKNLWNKLFSTSELEKNKNNNNLKLIDEIEKTPKSRLIIEKPLTENVVDSTIIFKFFILSKNLRKSDNLENNKITVHNILSAANKSAIKITNNLIDDVNTIISCIEDIYKENNETAIQEKTKKMLSEFIKNNSTLFNDIGISIEYTEADLFIADTPYNLHDNKVISKLYREYDIPDDSGERIYARVPEIETMKDMSDNNLKLSELLSGLDKKIEVKIEKMSDKIIKELRTKYNDKTANEVDPLLKIKLNTIHRLDKILTLYTLDLIRALFDVVKLTSNYVKISIANIQKNSILSKTA